MRAMSGPPAWSRGMIEDHYARQQAALANQKIDDHEDKCAERWREARDQMMSIKRAQWWMVATLVGGQGAVILFLADRLL